MRPGDALMVSLFLSPTARALRAWTPVRVFIHTSQQGPLNTEWVNARNNWEDLDKEAGEESWELES